jgi:hypothetical protein
VEVQRDKKSLVSGVKCVIDGLVIPTFFNTSPERGI